MTIYTYLDTRCSTLADRQLALPGAMRGWVAAARTGRCACGEVRAQLARVEAAAGYVAMHLACGVDVERDR